MKNAVRSYITSSIAYINSKPHIGYALELVQTDTLARFHRLFGRDVFFSTGTDEHGQKIQQKAEESHETPEVFAQKISEHFLELTKLLNLSNDAFIRTSTFPTHAAASKRMWDLVEKAGFLYKKAYEGLYCVGCERFYTEKELVDGTCPIHHTTVEKVSEENWFFALSKFSQEITKKIESDEVRVLPEERKNEILNVTRSGLEDISVSRSREKLTWGIPVPGDDTQVMYVWFDALTNYLSVLGWGSENESLFEKFWTDPETEIVHVIGKDILRQHAAIWIGMLLAAGLRLPTEIFSHGFVTSGGEKMSKSLGNVVDPVEVVQKYGVDAVRYYLLSQIPTLSDGDFSADRFQEVYNADLKNGLGNLVNRITNIVEKKLNGTLSIPKGFENSGPSEQRIRDLLEKRDIKAICEMIMKFTRACDAEMNHNELWVDSESKHDEIYRIIYFIQQVAVFLLPVMPGTAESILNTLNVEDHAFADLIKPRAYSGIKKPALPLFPPI